MPIALFSDIHANREAFSACLAHARRHRVDRYAFLGDLVGYGADPVWVVEIVMSAVAAGSLAVLGNHDAAVALETRPQMRADARRVVEWTRTVLNRRHLEFLSGLPLEIRDEDRLYVHANAWRPAGWEYISGTFDARRSMRATTCRITFCGHTHEDMLYHMDGRGRVSAFSPVAGTGIRLISQRRWLAIPGTGGQPRDGVLAARYAIFDEGSRELTYFRVPYDHETAARKMRKARVPKNPSAVHVLRR
jgi:diadenosine tetraphosphatase ApaH/serine/threonine PP2A family protein phosphatase